MAQKLSLGEILVAGGAITAEQRDKALKASLDAKCLFGDAVVKLGFASEGSVAMAVSKQLGIPWASKENKILVSEKGQGLEKLIPEGFARENLVIPLFAEDGVVGVAMAVIAPPATNISPKDSF